MFVFDEKFHEWVEGFSGIVNTARAKNGDEGYMAWDTGFAQKAWLAGRKELEAENQKLREQRDAANAQIQMLNSIIAGDVE